MLEAHVVACNIYVEHHTVTVDVETGQLLALSLAPALTRPLDWEAWTTPKGANHWDIGSRHNRYSNWVNKVTSLISISYLNSLKYMNPFNDGAMHPGKICMTQSRATCYGISLLQQ